MGLGWQILIAYLIVFLLTWIAATGMLGRSEHFAPSDLISVTESALFSSFLGFGLALLWPLVLIGFFVYRIAMKPIRRTDQTDRGTK